jgi:hypothetical protein
MHAESFVNDIQNVSFLMTVWILEAVMLGEHYTLTLHCNKVFYLCL